MRQICRNGIRFLRTETRLFVPLCRNFVGVCRLKAIVRSCATGSSVFTLRKMFFATLVPLLLSSALAQESAGQGDVTTDARTLAVQRKVDELFESGKFERAYFIYRNELAPVGDKYAQYMVGYMHLMGLGVEEDEVRGSAWYRLAAERGYPEFVGVRNQVLGSLDEDELERSDRAYIELRSKYGDLVLVMGQLHRDFDELTAPKTGTRLTRRGTSVMLADPVASYGISGQSYQRNTEFRFRSRLDFVTDTLGIDRVSGTVTSKQLNDLSARVEEHVAQVDDR